MRLSEVEIHGLSKAFRDDRDLLLDGGNPEDTGLTPHPIDRDELIVPEILLPGFGTDTAGCASSKGSSREGAWLGG